MKNGIGMRLSRAAQADICGTDPPGRCRWIGRRKADHTFTGLIKGLDSKSFEIGPGPGQPDEKAIGAEIKYKKVMTIKGARVLTYLESCE